MNSMLARTLNWVWVFSCFAFFNMKIPTFRDHSSTILPSYPRIKVSVRASVRVFTTIF